MFWKRDTIDEMDRTTVDEMDRTVVDDMAQTPTSDYYDSTRYYDPSRYGTVNDRAHDSHLCEEGHDHDENDRRRSASYSQPKEKTPYGGHLCEDGEHHERTAEAWKRLESKHNTVTYKEGKEHPTTSGIPFTPAKDYSPKPPASIYTNTGNSGEKKNPASLRTAGIIAIVLGIILIDSIGMVLIIAGFVMMSMAKAVDAENKQNNVKPDVIDSNQVNVKTAKTIIVIAGLIVIVIAFMFVLTSISSVMSELE